MSNLLTPDGQTRSQICGTFNKIMTKLVKILIVVSKKSIKAESLKNKLRAAVDEDRELVIKEGGPYIIEHKEYIDSKDCDFFSKIDFVGKYGKTEAMKTNMSLFQLVKDKWPKMTPKEQEVIGGHMQVLLDCAMKFRVFNMIQSGKIGVEDVGFIKQD